MKVLVFLCISFISLNVLAQSKLTVVTESWPPYNYSDAQEQIAGIATEVVESVLNEANIDFEITVYPWARAYQIASSTPNTLIYSLYRTPEREPLFYWYCPILPVVDLYLYGLKENSKINIRNIEDVKNYKTAVSRLDYPYKILTGLGFKEGEHIYSSPTDLINLKKLFSKDVDFVPTSKASLQARLKSLNLDYSLVKPYFKLVASKNTPICMALNRKSDRVLAEAVEASFAKIINNQ